MIVVWSAQAIDNLINQLTYIRQENPSAAARMALEIDRQAALLGPFPGIGRLGRIPGTREIAIDRTPYIAIYRIRSATVEILRLLHGAQRFP